MFCKNCGEEIKDGVKFCGKCGASVQEKNSNTSRNEQAAALVNEGKNLVLRFFTKNPSGVIKEASRSKSYIGFVLIAVNAILFAFVACFNVPQSGVYIFNSLVNSIQEMAASIGGSSLGGSIASAYLPTADASPIFNLFLPLFFVSLIMLAIEFAGMYIALRVKHTKLNHYANAINVIGIATLPLSAVMILNFILGFIYPLAIPFVFTVAVFIHMAVVYEGLRHIINDGNSPILAFSIIIAIICAFMLIIFAITVNKISGTIQQSISDTMGGVISGGLEGMLGSIFGN